MCFKTPQPTAWDRAQRLGIAPREPLVFRSRKVRPLFLLLLVIVTALAALGIHDALSIKLYVIVGICWLVLVLVAADFLKLEA